MLLTRSKLKPTNIDQSDISDSQYLTKLAVNRCISPSNNKSINILQNETAEGKMDPRLHLQYCSVWITVCIRCVQLMHI